MKKEHILVFLAVFAVYSISGNGETHYNYFSLLAEALSQGRLYVSESTSALAELIPISEDKYYVPYAPMPALVLLPFSIITKTLVPQALFSHLFGALLSLITYITTLKVTLSKAKAMYLALLLSFGTNVWFTASVGSSWYFAQIVAAVFLSSAIYSHVSKKSPALTGLLLGMAYMARPHTILSLPFFLFASKFSFKKTVLVLSGILPSLAFNAGYNFIRFGAIWDKGYTLIPNVLDEPWYQMGIFHISYIKRHIDAVFLALPRFIDQFPYIVPDMIGMAIWVTTPAIILLLKIDLKDRNTKAALLSIILVLIPILTHGTTGFTQFGYRFAIDVYPFVFLLLAYLLKKHDLKAKFYLLLILSVSINLWGVLFVNKLGYFV